MTKSYEEAKERIPSQRERILKALRDSGKDGVTNVSLSKIALRWTARMAELYEKGYKISCDSLGSGIYKYVLIEEPVSIAKPEKALDILLNQIDKIGDTISKEQLIELLNENRLTVARKVGYYR